VKKHTFNATAARTGKTVRLNLSGYINTDSERVSSAAVNDALDQVEDGDTLEVHIRNLYGGSVPEGLTIFHDLAQYTPDVVIDGVAASMGAVIAMAGPVRKMSKHSRLMLHRVSIGASGDPDQVKERADQAQKWEDELVDILATATGNNPEDVRTKYMVTGKDHWLSADEAKRAGFVHEVVAGSMRKLISTSELENKEPEDILNTFDDALAPEAHNERTTDPIMKLFGKKASAIEVLKGVNAEDLTPEQLTAATKEINAAGVNTFLVPVTAEVKNASELQAHLDTLEANMASEKKRATDAEAEVAKLKAQVKTLSAKGGDTETPDTPPEGADTKAPGDETPQEKEAKAMKAAVADLPHNQLAKRLIGQE
jgi:ATP-dependent protease ClpP protease subunit